MFYLQTMKFLNLLFIPLIAFLVLSCSSDDLEDIIDPKTVPDTNTGSTKSVDLSQGLAPQNLLGRTFLILAYTSAGVTVGTTVVPDGIGTSGTANWSMVTSEIETDSLGIESTVYKTSVQEGTFTYSKTNPDIGSLTVVSGENSNTSTYTIIFESTRNGRFIDRTTSTNSDDIVTTTSFNGTFAL